MDLHEVDEWTYGAYSTARAAVYARPWSGLTDVRAEVTDGSLAKFLNEVRWIGLEAVSDDYWDCV